MPTELGFIVTRYDGSSISRKSSIPDLRLRWKINLDDIEAKGVRLEERHTRIFMARLKKELDVADKGNRKGGV